MVSKNQGQAGHGRMLTMDFLVELFVKHHPSIQSIAIMQSLILAIAATALGQDRVRGITKGRRSSSQSLPSKRKTLQIASKFLIMLTGRGMSAHGHILCASSAA